MDTQVQRIAFSKVEAARALGLSLRTIDNLIAAKELVARRIGRRVVIPVTSLQTLIRSDRPTGRRQSKLAAKASHDQPYAPVAA